KKYVDAYIIISNDKLKDQYGEISYNDAFRCANNVLKQTIRTIIDVIAVPGIINLDFADLETVIKSKGEAVVGIGQASGDDRAVKAITSAISSPILESSIVGATDAIVHFSASSKVTLNEIDSAIETMRELVGEDINIIFGINNSISEESDKLGEVFVSVIATGLKENSPRAIKEIQEEIHENLLNKQNAIPFENEKTREFLVNNGAFQKRDFVEYNGTVSTSDDEIADILKS
ncbi:cell division protein FtsZ, partial [Metamycoplasma neophronis]